MQLKNEKNMVCTDRERDIYTELNYLFMKYMYRLCLHALSKVVFADTSLIDEWNYSKQRGLVNLIQIKLRLI